MMKTPEELGISLPRFEALAEFVRLVDEGAIPHHTQEDIRFYKTNGNGFNMLWWDRRAKKEYGEEGCGTAMCIGGWTEHLRPNCRLYSDDRRNLDWLFYPNIDDYGAVTPKEAARVVRIFLITGERLWEDLK